MISNQQENLSIILPVSVAAHLVYDLQVNYLMGLTEKLCPENTTSMGNLEVTIPGQNISDFADDLMLYVFREDHSENDFNTVMQILDLIAPEE